MLQRLSALTALSVVVLSVGGLALPLAVFAAAAPPASDPDTGARSSVDTTYVVENLDPPGHYRLIVQNTTGIGYINSFRWDPPPGVTVTVIHSTTGGTCSVSNGGLQCSGKIAPPSCTCLPGGKLVVDFYATGSGSMEGMSLQIEQMTPVPWHIPSFLGTASTALDGDAPLCKQATKATKHHKATKAQVNTAAHPCTPR